MWYSIDNYFGQVRMRGATRLDFVQRMSTGDVARLRAGEGATTVFTTPIGRIVDYTRVLCFDESLLMLTGGENQDKLIRWLRKYVFFNDDVHMTDESAQGRWMAAFDEDLPDEVRSLPLHGHVIRDGALWVRCALGANAGAWVLFTDELPASVRERAAPMQAFEAVRVAEGVPRFPNELGEDYIPLEAGVWDAVSFRKGCYVGQEIIARMESRGQLARRLVRLSVVSGAVAAGTEIMSNGQPCGHVTSVSAECALGYLRSAAYEVGRMLDSESGVVRVEGLAGVTSVS
jgi:aminomethyltransferase